MSLLPLSYPITGRELWGWGYTEGKASFRPKIRRTKWLYWGGTILRAPPPHIVPATYILSMS